MHPGQYTVLNSLRRSVVGAARAELLYHTDFLDHLRLDATHKIVLHVGGLYGNRNASLRRFRKQFRALPANVKARLVLENDERNYGTEEVLALSDALGVPMVFDCFHHIAHAKELPSEKLLARVYEGWSRNDGPPELHYSTQRVDSRAGSHANMIDAEGFIQFLRLLPPANVDIMLEAKSKDVALLSLRQQLLTHRRILDEWAIT
jgi:UV DNA damage endonuclease